MAAEILQLNAQTQINGTAVQVGANLNVDYGQNTVGGTLTLSGSGQNYNLADLTLNSVSGPIQMFIVSQVITHTLIQAQIPLYTKQFPSSMRVRRPPPPQFL